MLPESCARLNETQANKTLHAAQITHELFSLRMAIYYLETVLRGGINAHNIVRMPSQRYLRWADAEFDRWMKHVLAERRLLKKGKTIKPSIVK